MRDRRRIVGSGLVFAALLLVCLVALVGLQTGASPNSASVATSAKEASSQSSRLDRGLRSAIMVLKGQSDNSSTRTIARRLKRVFVKLNKASTVNRRRTI